MSVESGPSNVSGDSPSQRKYRGAIAIQACGTCRSRKQKCDERRPKCSYCYRINVACQYREPEPTKKDKILVEIMDRLKIIEVKVDRMLTQPVPLEPDAIFARPPSRLLHLATDQLGSFTPNPVQSSQRQSRSSVPVTSSPYKYTSAAYKILIWPVVQHVLLQSQPSLVPLLRSVAEEASAFIAKLQIDAPGLPIDNSLADRPFDGILSRETRIAGGVRVRFPDLTIDIMHKLATAYFDTFNLIYPFMDRPGFLLDTLVRVNTEGFGGDTTSIIALLVFALGELAVESSSLIPINNLIQPSISGTEESDRPPGLALFNEARKRISLLTVECDLENVQALSLAALYYQSCSHYIDFWRLMVSAASACQALIIHNKIDWSSLRGDLIKRLYWHCALMEMSLHLELNLPLTGITEMKERVGLPTFVTAFCEADHQASTLSHYKEHYASQLALKRLCVDLQNKINNSMTDPDALPSEEFIGPKGSTLNVLSAQLDQWRQMLPEALQWPEDDPCAFPSRSQAEKVAPMFTASQDVDPVHYHYAYDIQVALLRTSYYNAKYMIHRPFVYKALHFPAYITEDDARGVAECLRACLKWPLAFSPVSRRKRLIPYLFCWSQNFLAVLITLHMCNHSRILQQIRQSSCGPAFEADAEISFSLMVEWIRDIKGHDAIARWCFKILSSVFSLPP